MPERIPCTPSVGNTDFRGVKMADFLNAFEAFLNGDISEKDVPGSEDHLVEVSSALPSGDPVVPVILPITSATVDAPTVSPSVPSISALDSQDNPLAAVAVVTPVVPPIIPIVPPIIAELKAPPDTAPAVPPVQAAAGNHVPSSTESDATLSSSVPVKPIVPPIRLRTPPLPPLPIPPMEIKPVKGKVYPPTYPPSDRPGRNTNQLLFIKRYVITALWKHKFAWPFKKPVDAEKLKLPDYHKIIKQPMDFGTIRKRLQNKYYWCAEECKKDFEQVFFNCFLYNKPDQDIVFMGKTLEKLYNNKLQDMMSVEKELDTKVAAPRKKQLVAPSLKRSYTGDSDQGRYSTQKKMKNIVDYETEIPISQISAPNKQFRKSPMNGRYSDSDSDSDSESEDSEEESQSTIQPERHRKEKLSPISVGGGRSGVSGGLGRSGVSGGLGRSGVSGGLGRSGVSGGLGRSGVPGGGSTTPLSERKPVKHHCKYCDQPFISRYVRDMHEKQKHMLNNFSSERKAQPSSFKPITKSSKPDTTSAGSEARVEVKPSPGDGLQIIPVSQSLDSSAVGGFKGGVASAAAANNTHTYDHTNFVDKKHQALHKQAMRNKAKISHMMKPVDTDRQMAGGVTGKVAGSLSGNGMAAGLSNGRSAERENSIPEDMLFPLPEDYTIKPTSADTFSNNSPGSEKSNLCYGSKNSPDSGYLSSRGMPVVDTSNSYSRSKVSLSTQDKFPVVSEAFGPTDSFTKSSGLSSLSTPVSSNLATSRSADLTSLTGLGSEVPLCLTTSDPTVSRMTEDNRLTDLQEELGFVEPTFQRSNLGCEKAQLDGSKDSRKFAGNNTIPAFDYRSSSLGSPQILKSVKVTVSNRPPSADMLLARQIASLAPSQPIKSRAGANSLPTSAINSPFSLDLSTVLSTPTAGSGEPRPISLETRQQPPLLKEKSHLTLGGGIPSTGGLVPKVAQPRVSPASLNAISSISSMSSNGGTAVNRRPRGLILATAGLATSSVVAGGTVAPLQPRMVGPAQRLSAGSGGGASSTPASVARNINIPVEPRSAAAMSVSMLVKPALEPASTAAKVTVTPSPSQTTGRGRAPVPAATTPKMDVLAQTLKLSDLDFNEFEAEPAMIQENQTQELKLEDLKHLRNEPPLPIAAAAAAAAAAASVRSENKVESSGTEDLRDLLEFSNFSYSDVRPISGPSENLTYPSSEPVFTVVTSQSVYSQSSLPQTAASGSPFQPTSISTSAAKSAADRDSFSGNSFPLYGDVLPGEAGFSVPSGIDFEIQSYPERKTETSKSWWP